MKLAVSETFYSIQGEGARAGEASFFIRLQGCKAKGACYVAGVRCDTEFESGKELTLDDLLVLLKFAKAEWIVWTGGEPLDQLNAEAVSFFSQRGYKQALETSGLHPLPDGVFFDHVTVSPKVAEHVLAKNFPQGVHELRYVRHSGQDIPRPAIQAVHYFISPHFNGATIDAGNLRHCMDLVLANPKWRLSVQLHKLLQVL